MWPLYYDPLLVSEQQFYISRPMNNVLVIVLLLHAWGCQPFIKHKSILWRILHPHSSLSCKVKIHDVFDRRNYQVCHVVVDCVGISVYWFFLLPFISAIEYTQCRKIWLSHHSKLRPHSDMHHPWCMYWFYARFNVSKRGIFHSKLFSSRV